VLTSAARATNIAPVAGSFRPAFCDSVHDRADRAACRYGCSLARHPERGTGEPHVALPPGGVF
jgi:hypothetical protein